MFEEYLINMIVLYFLCTVGFTIVGYYGTKLLSITDKLNTAIKLNINIESLLEEKRVIINKFFCVVVLCTIGTLMFAVNVIAAEKQKIDLITECYMEGGCTELKYENYINWGTIDKEYFETENGSFKKVN